MREQPVIYKIFLLIKFPIIYFLSSSSYYRSFLSHFFLSESQRLYILAVTAAEILQVMWLLLFSSVLCNSLVQIYKVRRSMVFSKTYKIHLHKVIFLPRIWESLYTANRSVLSETVLRHAWHPYEILDLTRLFKNGTLVSRIIYFFLCVIVFENE